MVGDSLQVARVSLLKFQIAKAHLLRTLIPGVNEIFGNVDPYDISAQLGERNCGSAVATPEV